MCASITEMPVYGIWVTPISGKPGSPDHWVINENTENPWITTDYMYCTHIIMILVKTGQYQCGTMK